MKKKDILFFLFFFLSVLIFDSIFQFLNGKNFLGFQIYNGRISSFFGNELILGSFLVRLLPIILWFILCFQIDVKKYTFMNIVFFSLYFITIYLSGERTSFILSLILIFLIIIFIKKLRKLISYSFAVLILFILLTTIFNIGSTNLTNRMFIKTFNQITDNKLINNPDKKINKNSEINLENIFKNVKFYSKDHQGHINLALKLFNDNKMFGVGPKGFRYYCRSVNYDPDIGICSTHPHNTLIQIVSELGLLGLFFYIFAAIFVIIKFFQSVLKKDYNDNYLSFYAITFGLVINFFPFLPSGNFFNNWISIVIYYNIGIYFYSYQQIYHK